MGKREVEKYDKKEMEELMKKQKAAIVVILGIMIVLLAVADIYLYVQGRREIAHIQIKEVEAAEEDSGGKAYTVDGKMEAFTVTDHSKKIVADTSVLEDESDEEENVGDYIFADSDSRYLKASDLKKMSKKELRLARNELYARHGYIFEDEELSEYFNGKDWYLGSVEGDDFSDNDVFNKYEIANRNLILKYEAKKKR